jgi:hypothetical protein
MGFSPHIDSKHLLWKNDRLCQILIVSGVSVLFDEIFAPWTPDEEAQKIIEKMSRDDDHPGYSDHQTIARNAGVFTCAILIYNFLSSMVADALTESDCVHRPRLLS